jgi:hypothetical protein
MEADLNRSVLEYTLGQRFIRIRLYLVTMPRSRPASL